MNEMNEVYIFLTFWVFILGLCIGSFLNVVILRGLSEESIVFPSSKCPKCGNKLKWWMNIPVVSYLFLRGKCYYCKEKISIQYPVVEFMTGVIFLLIFSQFTISTTTLFYMIAASLLIAMCICDLKENVIIDIHAYILIFFGILYNFITGGIEGLKFAFIGAIIGFILYEMAARIGYIVEKGQRAFGEGDSLIAAGIGGFFGWKWLIVSVILSLLVMASFAFPYLLHHSYKTGKKNTFIALLVLIPYISGLFYITRLDFAETFAGAITTLIFALGIGIWFIVQILKDIKSKTQEGENSLCILPFGPAMVVSFFAIMFFAPQIEYYIKNYGIQL